MDERSDSSHSVRTWPRILAAVAIGLAGSIIIFVATPYNNFVLHGQYLADCYLPVAGLFLLLLLVLGVNPLLRKISPRAALTTWQLALILAMMLVASVVPSSGLLRQLPYALAREPLDVRGNQALAREYEKMDLPPSLFPDKIGYKAETPASEYFIKELPEGESIPWSAWTGPLVSWGTFVLCSWLMMVGLSIIVLHQWRQNERLPFPLLTLQHSLIEAPEEGRLVAPLFRCKSFWIAAGAVFLLHFLSGMKTYYPDGVPAIQLNWNLGSMFTDSPLRHLPGHIKMARLYFVFLGVAYFMPNRIGFSIWFFELAYGLYVVFGTEYAPPFQYRTIYEHRVGGMFALTAFIIWLGRAHWARVFRCMFRAQSDDDRRDRNAGWMLWIGSIGMFAWMWWVGVHPLWSLFYVFIAFMVSILITRIVAETGMPFIRIDFRYSIGLVKLAPLSWLGPVSLYFATVIAMLFPTASRVSGATMATHALGLDHDARPRWQIRVALLLLGVMVLGLVVSGASHLHGNYNHGITLDETSEPLNSWGTTRLRPAHGDLIDLGEGRVKVPTMYNQYAHLGFGALLAAVLQWLCLMTPRWPLHPIGLIMNASFYANKAWASVLFGWLSKVLLVKYGGARMYRAAKPAFLGLIMGEILAAVFWCVEPVVRVLLDLPHKVVEVLPW